jgi:hypothetical protein
MRGIKIIKVKRKTTIPRWRIRAAVKAVFSREAQEVEVKAQAANTGKIKRAAKAK